MLLDEVLELVGIGAHQVSNLEKKKIIINGKMYVGKWYFSALAIIHRIKGGKWRVERRK